MGGGRLLAVDRGRRTDLVPDIGRGVDGSEPMNAIGGCWDWYWPGGGCGFF